MKFLIPVLFFFFCLVCSAQNSSSGTNDPSKATLEQQFENLYKKSNNYQKYKVVEKVKLNGFWQNIADSLKQFNSTIAENRSEITKQAASIDALNGQIDDLNEQNAQLTEEKDGIYFMGSLWNKAKYKSFMWTLLAVLLLTSIFVILRFRRSNGITKRTRIKLSEVETEFENYKKSAISREQEVKRELQNYINKFEEIRGGV
ncbi:MAG: hypothetical protein AAF487_06195 [Bacteroidota bacterium]